MNNILNKYNMKGNRSIVALSLLLISGSKYSEAIELQNGHHHSSNYGSMRRLDGSLIDIQDEETPGKLSKLNMFL